MAIETTHTTTTTDPHVHVHEHDHAHIIPYKRICWSAIFAGALVGVGLGFLLHLFGMAIGLNAFSVNSSDGATTIAIGGLLGMLIGTIAAMFVAGYTAGYLGRRYCPRRNLGLVYGFVTWSLALLFSAILAAHVSHYAMGYLHGADSTNRAVTGTTATASTGTVTPADNTAANEAVDPTATDKRVDNTPADKATYAAYALFGLFFLGAMASCIGAYVGMSCKNDD